MTSLLLWGSVLGAALAAGLGLVGGPEAGAGLARARMGLWAVVLGCAVMASLHGIGAGSPAASLALGWNMFGVFAVMLAAIGGMRGATYGPGMFVPGLVVLSGLAGGVLSGFALAGAVRTMAPRSGVQAGAAMLGGLLLASGNGDAAWCGAGCLTFAALCAADTHPMRDLVALAAMLAAWRVGPPPVWCMAFGGLLLASAMTGQGRACLGAARLWVLLALAGLLPQAGWAWALGALGCVLQPRGAPLFTLVCPPLLAGWSVWLALHDVVALSAHPGLRLGFGAALVTCVGLEWHAALSKKYEPVDAWGISLCLAAMGAFGPLMLRAIAGFAGAFPGTTLVLQAEDGAQAWPMMWWGVALLFGVCVRASGMVQLTNGRMASVLALPEGLAWLGGLPVGVLRGIVVMRRMVRTGQEAMQDVVLRLRAFPKPAPLLVWLGVLVVGWMWLQRS